MAQPQRTEYEQSLEALSGNDFQDEVSAYLEGVIIDFQVVPAKPHGDAGLDGISHQGERLIAVTAWSIVPSRRTKHGKTILSTNSRVTFADCTNWGRMARN